MRCITASVTITTTLSIFFLTARNVSVPAMPVARFSSFLFSLFAHSGERSDSTTPAAIFFSPGKAPVPLFQETAAPLHNRRRQGTTPGQCPFFGNSVSERRFLLGFLSGFAVIRLWLRPHHYVHHRKQCGNGTRYDYEGTIRLTRASGGHTPMVLTDHYSQSTKQ